MYEMKILADGELSIDKTNELLNSTVVIDVYRSLGPMFLIWISHLL